MTAQRVIILTEGRSNPYNAKTATNYVRYKTAEVVALLDSTQRGKTSGELLGVGGAIPVVGSLGEAPDATTLVIGISPPGGNLPPAWRAIILEAADRGMHIISGLHEFLGDDPEIAARAARHGGRIVDVRKNNERSVARQEGLDPRCLRIHTVGHDCNVGKMVVSLELALALKKRGHDTKFVATGQTGMMLEGDGCPIDCVVADFINGAAENLVLQNQHHAIIVVEGQGTVVHPMYSGVTLGLLHGCVPDGLIMCIELGRTHIAALPHVKIPPLPELIALYEQLGSLMHPCKVIGIGINSRKVTANEAARERQRIRDEIGLPACDVLRDGPEELTDAVLAFKATLGK